MKKEIWNEVNEISRGMEEFIETCRQRGQHMFIYDNKGTTTMHIDSNIHKMNIVMLVLFQRTEKGRNDRIYLEAMNLDR